MNEFIEKLIGRLEEYKYSHLIERDSEMLEHCKEKEMDCEGSDCFLCVWDKATEIVNQLAEEYKDKVIIDGQYCWQTCGATEHCKECNRLCNGSIDYYENYDVLAEEYNNGWVPCSKKKPRMIDAVLVCKKDGFMTVAIRGQAGKFCDTYANVLDDVIAWRYLPEPFKPISE